MKSYRITNLSKSDIDTIDFMGIEQLQKPKLLNPTSNVLFYDINNTSICKTVNSMISESYGDSIGMKYKPQNNYMENLMKNKDSISLMHDEYPKDIKKENELNSNKNKYNCIIS